MAPVLGSVIAVVMAVAFPVVLTGAMSFKMRADIGFDSRAQGAVVTSYFLVSAVISTSCGRLTERCGSRCSMRVAAVLGGLACAGIALSDRLALLATFMVVGGVSAAIEQPATNALIMERIPHRRRGLAFGIKQSSIPAGTALAGVAVPVIALTVGWRWAFGGAALLAAIAAVTVPPTLDQIPRKRSTGSELLRGSYRSLVALTVAAALGAAPAMTLPAFLTATAVERDFSAGVAGVLLAIGSAGGLVVRLAAGARADRRPGDHLRSIALLMFLGALGLAGMASSRQGLFAVAAIVAFSTGWAWQGLFNHDVRGDGTRVHRGSRRCSGADRCRAGLGCVDDAPAR